MKSTGSLSSLIRTCKNPLSWITLTSKKAMEVYKFKKAIQDPKNQKAPSFDGIKSETPKVTKAVAGATRANERGQCGSQNQEGREPLKPKTHHSTHSSGENLRSYNPRKIEEIIYNKLPKGSPPKMYSLQHENADKSFRELQERLSIGFC